jgi:L-threonylcarbamoyladenylate synthase
VTPTPATPEAIAKAAGLLRTGAVIIYPTDTVYGIGGDATNRAAIDLVLRLKQRPVGKPLPVLVPDTAAAQRHARFDARAEQLAEAFWPGALSLVLPLRPDSELAPGVTADSATVALRVPDHPVALALLRDAGCPLAGPSANPAGAGSPTDAHAIAADLSEAIAMILDAGPSPVAVASTVLDLTGTPVRILRAGAVTRAELETVLGLSLDTSG